MGMKVPKGLCPTCLGKLEGGKCPKCPRKASKYRNRKTAVDMAGRPVQLDSRREARRLGELLLMQAAGLLSLLSLQPRFQLWVNGRRVCSYVADFGYIDAATGRYVVEDAKGHRTRAYRIKAKLFEALTGFAVSEV